MGSRVQTIVDYTAALAASVQGVTMPNGSVVGVRSVFGAGQGVIGDPLRPGNTIQATPERPQEPFQHVSRLPDAPNLEWISQQSVELTWTIPMTLYIQRGDAATAVQAALPFYDPYLAAFAHDPTLGGNVLIAQIKSFKPGTDEAWYWLDIEVEVTEVVIY